MLQHYNQTFLTIGFILDNGIQKLGSEPHTQFLDFTTQLMFVSDFFYFARPSRAGSPTLGSQQRWTRWRLAFALPCHFAMRVVHIPQYVSLGGACRRIADIWRHASLYERATEDDRLVLLLRHRFSNLKAPRDHSSRFLCVWRWRSCSCSSKSKVVTNYRYSTLSFHALREEMLYCCTLFLFNAS